MSKKVEMFQCDICGMTYSTEYSAKHCEFMHQKLDFANYLLEQGRSLGYINFETAALCGLPDELEEVTKDTFFKISYLQCNDNYVYRVCAIYDNAVDVQDPEDYHTFRVDYEDLISGMEKKNEYDSIME